MEGSRTMIWLFGDKDVNIVGDIKSLAMEGTALEFAYQRFNIARKKIAANDTVIVTLADFDRRWFFKAYPQAAITDASPTDNKKENKAIKLFRKHLDHKELHKIYLIDFLYNVHSLAEELNLNVILVPEFDDVKTFLTENINLFPLFKISEIDKVNDLI